MRYNKLSLCLFGISACFVVCSEAIIGGRPPIQALFQYLVALKHHNGEQFCGGGIIRDDAVITAAHCVVGMNHKFDNLPIIVQAGMHNLLEPRYQVEVAKIFVPKEFNPNTRIGDIAMLKLRQHFQFKNNFHLGHLKRLRRNIVFPNITGIIGGWGYNWMRVYPNGDEEGGRNTNELRWIRTDILSDQECELSTAYPGYEGLNIRKQFCARGKRDVTSTAVCSHDNGSPLVYDGYIIGVLSVISPGCQENVVPAIYTRILHYRAFLENSLSESLNDRIVEHILLPL